MAPLLALALAAASADPAAVPYMDQRDLLEMIGLKKSVGTLEP